MAKLRAEIIADGRVIAAFIILTCKKLLFELYEFKSVWVWEFWNGGKCNLKGTPLSSLINF